MQFRPLGIVKEILEEVGEEMTYTYEDLVFTEHNAFLVQFNDAKLSELWVFLNKDLTEKDGFALMSRFKNASLAREHTVALKGKYELHQAKGTEEFQVRFLP